MMTRVRKKRVKKKRKKRKKKRGVEFKMYIISPDLPINQDLLMQIFHWLPPRDNLWGFIYVNEGNAKQKKKSVKN